MLHDICTCPVSLSRRETLDDWDAMTRAFLAHGADTPVYLGRVLEAEPGFAMAHAAKSLFSMMMGRRELVDAARAANAHAQKALSAGGATPRERLWCQASDAWMHGSPSRAIGHMEEAMRLNPADTLSMKVSHAIRFILGDNHGMRRSLEAVIGAHGPDHALRGYALGCLSFAQEETGSYAEAERTGIEALHYASDDAWGLHAVAHVYDMTHRPDCGISLIEGNTDAWNHCNNFRFHVWWHKALLHLDKGEYAHTLDLYDQQIRNEKTDDYRDFSNASSLLMRLELEGVNVGDRWGELAELAESRSDDGCLVFADLHYMLALVGDNRPDAVARLTARVAEDAQTGTEVARIMKDPGHAAAEGLAAFGDAQYDRAFAHLAAVQPRFQNMGGSHAQRDVFERLTIESALRAGRLAEAEKLISARTRLRDGTADAFADKRLALIEAARMADPAVAAQ
ncbi:MULTISPECIES: tetratricopeptide repeat protein [unclassified Roseovarius]|uniref:tetratricopeptide repeat protein n=1 Tax=unclassified Roseovarius TaxID=2614913 RepID=UPI00274023D0|nr:MULTISPECIES: tetratricopeptide repeat protein [unclassified Roseovarius]